MKLYKVVLEDKREEFVTADTYQLVDDQYVFFANGEPVPDVFFRESIPLARSYPLGADENLPPTERQQ